MSATRLTERSRPGNLEAVDAEPDIVRHFPKQQFRRRLQIGIAGHLLFVDGEVPFRPADAMAGAAPAGAADMVILARRIVLVRDEKIAGGIAASRTDAAALHRLEHEGFQADAGLVADLLQLIRPPAIGYDDDVGAEVAIKTDVARIEHARRDADVDVEVGAALAHQLDAAGIADHHAAGAPQRVALDLQQEGGNFLRVGHDIDGDAHILAERLRPVDEIANFLFLQLVGGGPAAPALGSDEDGIAAALQGGHRHVERAARSHQSNHLFPPFAGFMRAPGPTNPATAVQRNRPIFLFRARRPATHRKSGATTLRAERRARPRHRPAAPPPRATPVRRRA